MTMQTGGDTGAAQSAMGRPQPLLPPERPGWRVTGPDLRGTRWPRARDPRALCTCPLQGASRELAVEAGQAGPSRNPRSRIRSRPARLGPRNSTRS